MVLFGWTVCFPLTKNSSSRNLTFSFSHYNWFLLYFISILTTKMITLNMTMSHRGMFPLLRSSLTSMVLSSSKGWVLSGSFDILLGSCSSSVGRLTTRWYVRRGGSIRRTTRRAARVCQSIWRRAAPRRWVINRRRYRATSAAHCIRVVGNFCTFSNSK